MNKKFQFLIIWTMSAFWINCHADTMKIMAWNIANLSEKIGEPIPGRNHIRDENDYQILIDYIKKIDADVIALQEMGSLAAAKKVVGDQYEIVMETRCDENAVKCQTSDVEHGIYTAIAYKKELTDLPKFSVFQIDEMGKVEHIDECGSPPRRVRGSVGVSFEWQDQTIWIPSIHLKASCKDNDDEDSDAQKDDCDAQERQFDELVNWINSLPNTDTAIIAGDFNRKLYETDDYRRAKLFNIDSEAVILPEDRVCWLDYDYNFERLRKEARDANEEFNKQEIEPFIYELRYSNRIDYFVGLNLGNLELSGVEQLAFDEENPVKSGTDLRETTSDGFTITDCDGNIVTRGEGVSLFAFADGYPSDHCPIVATLQVR